MATISLRGMCVAAALWCAFSSTAAAQNSYPSVGVAIRGTPKFEVTKSEQGDQTTYRFNSSDGNSVTIRLQVNRSFVPKSVTASWSKVLLESASVTLRLAATEAVLSEADEKGGLLLPPGAVTCIITPIDRDSSTNGYRLQCVAADEDGRWMNDEKKMVTEISMALIVMRGSPADALLLSKANKALSAWIE